MPSGKIFIIEDDIEMLENYSRILKRLGYTCITESDSLKAIERLRIISPDVILTDLRMPSKNGFDVLKAVREFNADIPVVLITAFADIPTTVKAIKEGAFDFIAKPFTSDQLSIVIERALKQKMLSDENRRLKEQLRKSSPNRIITNSHAMHEILKVIDRVSQTDANVLITGESGTGKELIARIIHSKSSRAEKPFIPVDCAAIPDNLLESELFGYEKGAFTGANTSRTGLFEAAQGGTLFLDEVGEIPLPMQAKLLRVIQERQVRPLGSNRFISIDVRIISATNRDIKKNVSEGTFRDDLYYRLNVIHINVPPLRDRKGDIPALALHFLQKFALMYEKDIRGISPDAMEVLENYAWPGNVRELQNVMERAVILCDGDRISLRDIPREVCMMPGALASKNLSYKDAKKAWIAMFEKDYLTNLLKSTSWNISRAAEKAGINRRTIHRLIKRYGLSPQSETET